MRMRISTRVPGPTPLTPTCFLSQLLRRALAGVRKNTNLDPDPWKNINFPYLHIICAMFMFVLYPSAHGLRLRVVRHGNSMKGTRWEESWDKSQNARSRRSGGKVRRQTCAKSQRHARPSAERGACSAKGIPKSRTIDNLVVRETHKIAAHALPASREVREYHWEQLWDRAAQGVQVLKAGRTCHAGTGNAWKYRRL
ncbi:hypothetical protein B0H13DRAFT_2006285 [Mycena leptocephala]|nr:hypothetical protein B0H13DRAFT_2006285 [Mycena leptocephala]